MRAAALGAFLVLAAVGCRHDPGLPPREAEEAWNLRRGRVLYPETCGGCHGERGRGDGLLRRQDGVRRPADLNRVDDEGWVRWNAGRGGRCPDWTESLTVPERRALEAYARSLGAGTR